MSLLLFGYLMADHNHGCWKYIFWIIWYAAVRLILIHNISNIIGVDAEHHDSAAPFWAVMVVSDTERRGILTVH